MTATISGNGDYGAGVVIDDHHVLTCFHVIERMKSIRLSIAEDPEQDARVVERDPALDLAILSIQRPAQKHAVLASASSAELGDQVWAMGAPRKMGFSLSSGIVSYAGRAYSGLRYLQTDIATNGGSSGGPLFDEEGRVLAITSFILRDSQGLSFALPIDYAYRRFRKYFAQELDGRRFEAWLAHRAPSETGSLSAPSEPAAGGGPRAPAR